MKLPERTKTSLKISRRLQPAQQYQAPPDHKEHALLELFPLVRILHVRLGQVRVDWLK